MRQISTLILALTVCLCAFGKHPEYDRLSGFAEHQKSLRSFDKEREAQELEHLEEQYKWELERLAAINEHQKQKAIESPKEGGPEWKEDQAEKRKFDQEIETARLEQIKKRDQFNRENYPELPTEAEELGLYDFNRPRYDLKKRPAFGAPSKWTAQGSGAGSSRGSGGSSSGGSAFPPPPPFDDFGDDGFVPAPNLGGDFDSGDFPPPPPPPPPPFSDGGDFPDIPPPIPGDFGEGMPDAF